MAKIYNSAAELVGNTPLLRLNNIERELGLKAKIIAKVESFNPAGSVKDRVALNMLDEALLAGKLNSDTVIIEATSGNTGIGLASVCAARGYRLIIVMPDTMSVERRMLLELLGAELVLTDGSLGMSGAIERAEQLHKEYKNSIIAGQFVNPANPDAHYKTTGPEIYEGTDGEIDYFVAGIGTGGTISGVGKYLKEKNANIKVVGVEPKDSAVLTGGKPGPHKLQGIGAGFVPDVLDTKIYDEILPVSNEDAYAMTKLLGKREGILCGISSGAALYAATELSKREDMTDKTIVVLLPDTGDRYLSVLNSSCQARQPKDKYVQ